MSLNAGTRLGPYEIIALLGAGGMGEVYRARDTRLDRTVALKILAPHLSSSVLRERFEREGRAVASLNHPHICTLHDIGQQDGIEYLVMECLQGETLAERLKKGPLPLDQALGYGIQIADALDRAHRHGVVHRDLKPANIMLTKDGPKILDFGLAKVGPSYGSPQDGTYAHGLTTEGTILGTPQYMAPEQLEGKEADARTDIFAFGAVLYEMATGLKAFEGHSQASLITAIMSSDPPPLSAAQPVAPFALDHVVSRCLSKDPDQRWQTARDLMLELRWVAGAGSNARIPAEATTRRRNRERLVWSVGLLALLAVVVFLAATRSRSTSQPMPTMWAPLLPPTDWTFRRNQFAISPDGARVAFVALASDGNATLWTRALIDSTARRIDGTEGAISPFWSPDSRRVGFHADGKLKTVDIQDGSVETLTGATARGGTWNRDGTIVFVPSFSGPLYRIPQAGGESKPVTKTLGQDGAESHAEPFFLPDGKHFLYSVRSTATTQRNGIYVGSLDSSAAQRLLPEVDTAAYASGRLLYVRGRRLMTQPFDPLLLETTGPAEPMPEAAIEEAVDGRPAFSASQNGVLLFQSDATSSQLVWFDARGRELGSLPNVGSKYPRFSPDGRFLAVASDDARNGKYYIRVYDLSREGVSTRLTSGGNDLCPVWSPDGKEVLFASIDRNNGYVYKIAADGTGAAEVLLKGARVVPNDWSPKGHLVFMDFAKGPPQLATYSFRDQTTTLLGPESEAQFSPDGEWIVYSGPRGAMSGEILVQRFPGPGGRVQISRAGGGQPRWSRDGRRIFFLAPDKKLMSVNFDRQAGRPSAPEVLFQTRVVAFAYDFYQYDVAPDGRFLINSLPSAYSSPLTLVTGWTSLLKGQ